MTTIKRQIIAMGGGGFSMEPDNPLLDQYIIEQARKTNPSVCFFPHATDDAVRYVFNFYNAFTRLNARPTYLSLFTPPTADLESFILEQDVIYVGGGNTKSMLALWREWNLDDILYKAYQAGVVLAGLSAGANCWFREFSTDSIPGKLGVLPGLGFIDTSFCPHYDGESERRPSLHHLINENLMIPGYAADDGAAAHFIDDRLFQAISSRPAAKVYHIDKKKGPVSEEMIETHFLGSNTDL
ncbi:MAG TPA: Type 1 glutamine amidotransferase-like domain-containing protein [Mucilaginibacter sp.]|jgi:peptidase E